MEVGTNYFGVADYILLSVTLLISLLIGLYYGYKSKNTNEELLVGGRNMSILPVAASVMVTYISAITILGVPSEVYANGSQIFVHHVVSAFGITFSAFLIMPFFYRMKLTSINEYLERRFDSKWIRWLASVMFILQQVTLNGVILYAPSIAMEAFLGVPMWISVLGIGVCATIYTNIGGLKAVVWTDAFQCLMMITGMVVIMWKGISASGGIKKSFQLASEGKRLQVFEVIAYSAPLKLLIMTFCMITGLSIFAFYAHCDPLTKGDIKKADQIVTYFVVHELTDVPGMMGLFTSCIFSAVLSSLSSSLNSLAAVTWEDFLSRHKYFRSMSPKSQTNVSRFCGVIYGIICIGLAFSAQNLGTIFTATFAVIGATAGTLYGVFLMAMFMPWVNAVGAFIGMLSGFTALGIVSIVSLFYKTRPKANLPLSIDECPVEELEAFYNFTTPTSTFDGTTPIPTIAYDEWPGKVFQLSYLLYAISAAIISIFVGILVSFITSTFVRSYKNKKLSACLVHPVVRSSFGSYLISENCKDNRFGQLYKNDKQYSGDNNENMDSHMDRREQYYLMTDFKKEINDTENNSGSDGDSKPEVESLVKEELRQTYI